MFRFKCTKQAVANMGLPGWRPVRAQTAPSIPRVAAGRHPCRGGGCIAARRSRTMRGNAATARPFASQKEKRR